MNNRQLISLMQNAINSNKSELVISEFTFNEHLENELLFFFKPECFINNDPDFMEALFNMVFDKFMEFDVEISKVLLLDGKRLKELSIMDQHYGLINKLSRSASKLLSDDELQKIQQSLNINISGKYRILGGHEFMTEFTEFDEKSLKEFWFTKKPIKLRSGFYYHTYNLNNENIILINGFHPDQLLHFTNNKHRIVLLLLQSNTDWKILKNDLVGNTFPEKAEKLSIRGELYNNNKKYGIKNVSISSNCVHLSAGPFEALFEINNFLKNLNVIKYDIGITNMYRLMNEIQITNEMIKNCLLNPVSRINNNLIDLFTFTEDKNSINAISDYLKYYTGN